MSGTPCALHFWSDTRRCSLTTVRRRGRLSIVSKHCFNACLVRSYATSPRITIQGLRRSCSYPASVHLTPWSPFSASISSEEVCNHAQVFKPESLDGSRSSVAHKFVKFVIFKAFRRYWPASETCPISPHLPPTPARKPRLEALMAGAWRRLRARVSSSRLPAARKRSAT